MNVQEIVKGYIVDDVLFGDDGRVTEDVSFQKSGILDSTGFLGLITFVEEKFGISVADDEVVPENFDSLKKISAYVERKMNGNVAAS